MNGANILEMVSKISAQRDRFLRERERVEEILTEALTLLTEAQQQHHLPQNMLGERIKTFLERHR